MKAEWLAASATARGIDPMNVGRSSRPYDEKRAYFAGISDEAWLYVRVVYLGEDTPDNRYRLYLNVLWAVVDDWQPIGEKPEDADGIERWRENNTGLVRKLTDMALTETINRSVGGKQKVQWRASQTGVGERRWHQIYRERYDRIWLVIDGWDRDYRVNASTNQRVD